MQLTDLDLAARSQIGHERHTRCKGDGRRMPATHGFLPDLSEGVDATGVGCSRLPHVNQIASRKHPTCGDERGHDGRRRWLGKRSQPISRKDRVCGQRDRDMARRVTRSARYLLLLLAVLLALIAPSHRVFAEDTAAQGARIYANYCATCHGDELQNNSNGLTFDLRRLKSDEYPRFVNSVMNGKNKMPPWKGVLGENQIKELWAYIRATVQE
jgi:cytochrome c6